MDIVTSFRELLEVFAVTMTQPSLATWQQLVVGWIFAPRRTVLGMVRAAALDRHHAAFHRLFASARWSVDQAGLAIFDLALRLAPQETAFLVGDDTLLARRGLKVFGTGMHRDPLLSSRSHTVTRWGNCLVVLSLVLESPRTPGRYFALPILARLYLDKKAAAKWRRAYRTKSELMREMLERLHAHAPQQKLHFLGDSAYTAPAVLAQMPPEMEVTGRVVLNVRLYEPAPPRRSGQPGRPRKRGRRLPSPERMLEQPRLRRMRLRCYQHSDFPMRVAEAVGCFYHAPKRLVRVVAVEHLRGGRGREAFYSTCASAKAEQILRWFSWRWPIEVTFHDSKQHLGIGQAQNRKPQAVERTAPTGLLLYSLVVLWHEWVRQDPPRLLRKWRGKRGASFADMLATLRLDSLHQTRKQHLRNLPLTPGIEKILRPLEELIALAA